MNKANLIKKQLERVGRSLYIKDGEWISTPFYAYVSHLWRKKSSAFEPDYDEAGKGTSKYYLYIGPYDHDITSLSEDAVVELDGRRYEFKNADGVSFSGQTVYYTAILRLLEGDTFED